MAGGSVYEDDVWSSMDGASWTLVTAAAAFGERRRHASVVYQDKMWVIGGVVPGPARVNDVWYSSDGASWTEATAAAAFWQRCNHTCLAFDNKMWLIAGSDSPSTAVNDVWHSSDGVNWTEATSSAAFSERFDHTSLVYGNRMWVLSGYEFGVSELRDVWCSDVLPTPTPGLTETVVDEGLAISRNIFNPVLGEKVEVKWSVLGPGEMNLVVYNSAGEMVKKLMDRRITGSSVSGTVTWNATNESDEIVASGVYIVYLKGRRRFVGKVAVVK